MSHQSDSFLSKFGIVARTFARPSLVTTLEACRQQGFRTFQLNLSCAGLPTLPDRFEPGVVEELSRTIRSSGLKLVALSGTFNMIDPDLTKRREGLRRLDVLAENCRELGTDLVTLCTGTRDPLDMWKRHADNDDPSAWVDLLDSMRTAVQIAERHNIRVAFEPEIGNVVDTAKKARSLIDQIGSDRLKVVLDAANLIHPEALPHQRETIDEAFDLLSRDIAIVHAKEISKEGAVGETAPGKGVLDFSHVFRRYLDAQLDVPIVMHGLAETDVPSSFRHLSHEFGFVEGTRRFDHDGLVFRYIDIGSGLPFVFQHGLGGDCRKMFDLTRPIKGVRLISFDARFHGETRPLGPPEKIGFDQSADDLLALLDHLKIEKAIIGGLSMGAGIALNFAIRHPERTLALILSRPAWLDQAFPENVRMFPEMAGLMRSLGGKAGREVFEKSETYARILAESTDSAAAMLGMFEDPISIETVEKFERIPRACPAPDRKDWRSIKVPTLVLANHHDPIHPYPMGPELASVFPNSELGILEPKCVSVERHESDFNTHISKFIDKHFPDRGKLSLKA